MPSRLVEDVLQAWKEGEELLPSLTPLSSDHETVRLAVADLRTTYVALVDRGHRANASVEKSAHTINNALRAIRNVADRTGHG